MFAGETPAVTEGDASWGEDLLAVRRQTLGHIRLVFRFYLEE